MSRAPALPLDDALLLMTEVGQRLHMDRADAKRLVETDEILRTGLRYRGGTAYCLRSVVVRYLHWSTSTQLESAPRKAPQRKAGAA